MHKWESLKDALDAQVKIPLSIIYAVTQLKHDAERGRVKQNICDKAMGIYNKLRGPAYVLYQHMQLDIADIMVDFIRCVEGCDVDLAMYLHYVELTKLKLKSLKRREGVYYKIGKSHFLPGGKLAEDNDFPQPKGDMEEFFQGMDVHKNALVQAFLEYMEEYHPSDVAENLKGFLFFDLARLGEEAAKEDQIFECLQEEEDVLVKFAREDISFGPTKWDGQVYSQEALGSEHQLCQEILDHKLFVYKKFVRKINPSTGKVWNTQDAMLHLMSLAQEQQPSYLKPESSVVRPLLIKYLNNLVSTTTLECCFSAVKLINSPLCARCTEDQKNKMIICYKEAAPVKSNTETSQQAFDVELASTFWYYAGKTKNRRVSIPESCLSEGANDKKSISKSSQTNRRGRLQKAKRRKARKEALIKLHQIEYASIDSDGFDEASSSSEESEDDVEKD